MLETLFGPLTKEYCEYFYILEVIFFIITAIMTFIVLKSLVSKKPMALDKAITLIANPLLIYFINRLYYSMCVGSL